MLKELQEMRDALIKTQYALFDDGDPEEAAKDAANTILTETDHMLDYIRIVISDVAMPPLWRAENLSPEDYRSRVADSDHRRTMAHDAAIVGCRMLNRLAGRLGTAKIMDITEESPRQEIGEKIGRAAAETYLGHEVPDPGFAADYRTLFLAAAQAAKDSPDGSELSGLLLRIKDDVTEYFLADIRHQWDAVFEKDVPFPDPAVLRAAVRDWQQVLGKAGILENGKAETDRAFACDFVMSFYEARY